MKTAVEWLIENCHIVPKNELNKKELIEQAKEMEKQNICHFGAKCCIMTNQKKFWTIVELYNETFKTK
jgi:hypothetical protein